MLALETIDPMHGEHRTNPIDVNDHVDLADVAQVERWASRLGITSVHLRELVARVGPRLIDIEAELGRPENLD